MGVTLVWSTTSNSHAGRGSHQQGWVLGSVLHLLSSATADLWPLPRITEVQGKTKSKLTFLTSSNSTYLMAVKTVMVRSSSARQLQHHPPMRTGNHRIRILIRKFFIYCFCTLVTRVSCLPGLGAGERENIGSVSKTHLEASLQNRSFFCSHFLMSFPLLLLITRNVVLATTRSFLWLQSPKNKIYRDIVTASQCLEIPWQ